MSYYGCTIEQIDSENPLSKDASLYQRVKDDLAQQLGSRVAAVEVRPAERSGAARPSGGELRRVPLLVVYLLRVGEWTRLGCETEDDLCDDGWPLGERLVESASGILTASGYDDRIASPHAFLLPRSVEMLAVQRFGHDRKDDIAARVRQICGAEAEDRVYWNGETYSIIAEKAETHRLLTESHGSLLAIIRSWFADYDEDGLGFAAEPNLDLYRSGDEIEYQLFRNDLRFEDTPAESTPGTPGDAKRGVPLSFRSILKWLRP